MRRTDREASERAAPVPAVAACVIFLGAYVFIATEKWVTRTAAALGGAALVLALGISDAEAAFFSEETGVDWNVVFLLLGMMIIVGVHARDRGLRVPRDLGGQAGPRPALPADGAADPDHRRAPRRCWTTSPPCC